MMPQFCVEKSFISGAQKESFNRERKDGKIK